MQIKLKIKTSINFCLQNFLFLLLQLTLFIPFLFCFLFGYFDSTEVLRRKLNNEGFVFSTFMFQTKQCNFIKYMKQCCQIIWINFLLIFCLDNKNLITCKFDFWFFLHFTNFPKESLNVVWEFRSLYYFVIRNKIMHK